MVNGHWQPFFQWLLQLSDEAQQHWSHALAAAAYIKQILPTAELVRMGLVALVTAVLTSQATIVRLDERITALKNERELLVRKRDEQVSEIKRDIDRIEAAIGQLREHIAGMKK